MKCGGQCSIQQNEEDGKISTIMTSTDIWVVSKYGGEHGMGSNRDARMVHEEVRDIGGEKRKNVLQREARNTAREEE